MHEGKLIFAQLMDHLPMHTFRRTVERFGGDRAVRSFSCQDQLRAMAFAQLTWRDSLRDTVICLNAQAAKLYRMGFRGAIARSTLADANETRDWRLYAAFAQSLIAQARKLYADEPFGAELDGTAYALDTTTIDLCLALFPWAHFQSTKAAVKVHTQMDLRGNIPTFLHIDDGKSYDSDILDVIVPEAGATYVMDRGFVDFARLNRLTAAAAFFVIRARSDLACRRLYSRPVDKTDRGAMRPDHRTHRAPLHRPLSRQAAPRALPRSRDRQAAGVPHQQLHAARAHRRRPLSLPLADRAVLPLDQAEPAHQVVLRLQPERGAHPNLDRRHGLRARRHHQESGCS